MRNNPAQAATARAAGEEILQAIFGDDLQGCSISLDAVTEIVVGAIVNANESQAELLSLHEKAAEAFQLLATPPASAAGMDPATLRDLLAERLDTIRTLSQKLTAATTAAHAQFTVNPP